MILTNLKIKVIFVFLVLFPIKAYSEFQKEIKLIDSGKCEEALLENKLTGEENEETYNPKKLFIGKNTIKIFRIYTLNRRIDILQNNCKKIPEAFELAKQSLEQEIELSKIPEKEFDKALQYNEFQRKKNLADSYSRVANFFNDSGNYEMGIQYYKKNIEIYESIDLFKRGNLLNFNYSILAGLYNRVGELQNANKFKKKHLEYLGLRFGKKTKEYFDALFDVYYQYRDQGYYDFALDTLKEIDQTIDVNVYYPDDSFGELKLKHRLATAFYYNGDLDDAISTHKSNLNYVREKLKLPNTKDISDKLTRWELLILNDMALNTSSKFDTTGNFQLLDDAEQIYLNILKLTRNSDVEGLGRDDFITKENLSGIYTSKNDYDKALKYVKESYEECIIIKSANDTNCLGTLITYANILSIFDLKKAIYLLEQFISAEPKTNRSFLRERVNARGSLSVLYANLGNTKKSEKIMLEAVNLIDPTDSRFRDTYVLTMNNYYLQIGKNGQYENSIKGYLELIKYVDNNFGKESKLKLELLNNLGFSYNAIKDTENALKYYLLSEKLGELYKSERNLLTNKLNIGDIYFWRGDIKKSNEYYKEALDHKQYGPKQTQIFLYAGLSKTEAILGNFELALFYGNEGLRISEDFHGLNHPSNLQLLDSLALANSFSGNLEEKFKNLIDIYNIINDYSKGYLKENFNEDPNEYFQQIYSFLYTASERENNDGEDIKFKNYFEKNSLEKIDNAIFNLSETLRTTKVNINTNKMLQRSFFDDEERQLKLRYLDKKIDEYSKIPKFSSNNEEKKKITKKVKSLREEIEILKKELELGKLLKGDSFIYQNININQIQNTLDDDQIIIYYLNYPNNLYFGAITKDKTKFLYKYFKEPRVDNLVKQIRKSINFDQGSPSKFDFDSSKELYLELIEPFEDYIKNKKDIIIVPHGSLLSLPFEILVSKVPENKNINTDNWLIKNHNIIYYPSISSFYSMKNLKKIKLKNYFAGFGDPSLSKNNKSLVFEKKKDVKNVFLRGGIANVDKIRQFAELPKTSNELNEISNFFDNKDIFLKNDFNEKNIKSINLEKYSVLSFATHGVVANEITSINEPGLITTPPQKGSALNDGVLKSSEIKNLKLNAELVILSACNTASGDGSSSAEGLSGLASSFFYAGARSLMVSHWYVEDVSTVNLMKNTFNNLKRNNNLSEALRASKLDMMEDKSTSHPIFWAPFVLVGGDS